MSVTQRTNAAAAPTTESSAPLRAPPTARSLRSFERTQLETSFGRDLGHVRVHEGPAAAASARAIHAAAYTIGHDIVLGPNAPAFSTQAGRHLLAHEVAHTLQQRPLAGARNVELGARATPFERAADAAADRAARGMPAGFQPAAQIAPVIQRAEAGTYISTQENEPGYLDAAEHFFKFWGHPNVKRVSSMENVVDDLATKKGHIDTFRIVSHGSAGQMWLKTTAALPADRFDIKQSALRTAAEFRPLAAEPKIIDDALYTTWTKALLDDATTKPLLAGAGITSVPATSSTEGLFLRGLLEARFLAVVQGPDDKPAPLKNRAGFEAFTRLRRESYYNALLAAAADATARQALKINLDKLIREAPKALDRAGLDAHMDKDEQLAAGFLNAAGTGVNAEVAALTKEGAGGNYVTKLAQVRNKLDEKSHIEIRGCNVGESVEFLDSMRSLFGNPGHEPSVSAPDLFQYFFAVQNALFFDTTQKGKDRLAADFTSTGTMFDARQRVLKGEAMRAVNEPSLEAFAKKYGFDFLKLYLLNPELHTQEKWGLNPLVWLVARKMKAGTNKTFADFADTQLHDRSLGELLRIYNPHIKKQTIWDRTAGRDELKPDDDVWLCPPEMQKITIWDKVLDPNAPKGQGPDKAVPIRDRTSSPTATVGDYETSLRNGELFVFVDGGKVKMRLDLAHASSGTAKWLAARNYGPKPESAASIEKRFGTNMANITNVYVEFLAEHYPADVVTDPLFGDDPRYPKHIIKRPP